VVLDAAELSRIAAPTLLLWGDQDALFPRSHQDVVVNAVPRADLKIYEETGHWSRTMVVRMIGHGARGLTARPLTQR
jgi:hypothetical protein